MASIDLDWQGKRKPTFEAVAFLYKASYYVFPRSRPLYDLPSIFDPSTPHLLTPLPLSQSLRSGLFFFLSRKTHNSQL